MLTVGSLFSGIGGFELGLERTGGFKTVWQCEIDPFCQKVLAKHWPDVMRFSDIKEMRGNIPYVDVICGGFPCQPVSCAGKRKGKEDERWLWPEFYRVVCEVKPRWVLVENVPGLLSADSGGLFAGVLRDLAASGYDAEWNIVSAASVGAPHLRKRVFIVAYAQQQTDRSKIFGGEINRQDATRSTGGISGSGDGYRKADVADTHGEPGKSPIGNLGREQTVVETVEGIKEFSCVGSSPGKMAYPVSISGERRGEAGNVARSEGETESKENKRQRCGDAVDNSGPDVAYPHQIGRHGWAGMFWQGWRREPENGGAEITDPSGKGLSQSQHEREHGRSITECDWWAVEPDVGRVAHGIPVRVDRLRSLGNAIVPQCASFVGECVLRWSEKLEEGAER